MHKPVHVVGSLRSFKEHKQIMIEVQLQVNGADVRYKVPDHTLLVEFLRQNCRLTGTHVGCDTSQCGACTVNLDGVAVKSCTILAAQASGGSVVTVEGSPRRRARRFILCKTRSYSATGCSAGSAHPA